MPALQQVYAHDFRYNAQQVRLLLRPESAFPAFIKADVAPGLAVVADHTLQHGLDALRLQNLHLIRGQCMDVAAVKNTVLVKILIIIRQFALQHMLKLVYLRHNAVVAPFKGVIAVCSVLGIFKNINAAHTYMPPYDLQHAGNRFLHIVGW